MDNEKKMTSVQSNKSILHPKSNATFFRDFCTNYIWTLFHLNEQLPFYKKKQVECGFSGYWVVCVTESFLDNCIVSRVCYPNAHYTRLDDVYAMFPDKDFNKLRVITDLERNAPDINTNVGFLFLLTDSQRGDNLQLFVV